MVFSSQAFRAPSISTPKMRKTNVSSSVMGGGSRPKLGKTTVSSSVFKRQPGLGGNLTASGSLKIAKGSGYDSILRGSYVDPKYLPQKPSGIEQTLIETNSILVEIQKQLAVDFSNRISERESEIKLFRKESENQRRSKKESSLEGFKKIGKTVNNAVSGVAKPFKSIFSKIFEFLSLIATGIIVNNALKWLSDPENRKKIGNVFNWLADNWKLLGGIIVGGIALKALYKVIRLVRAVKGILRFLKILPKNKPGSTPTGGGSTQRGGLIRNAAGQRRGITTSRLMRNGIPQVRSAAVPGSGGLKTTGVSQFTRVKGPLAKVTQMAQVLTAKAGRDVLKRIGLGPGARGIMGFLRPVFKRIPIFGALIDFAVSLALGEPIGRAAAKAVGAALGGALGSLIPIPGVGTLAGSILGDYVGSTIYDAMTKGGSDDKKQKFRLGGIIEGPSHASGGVDINAEGGEFIVKKERVPLYEPQLVDINENGGRMWQQFVEGVKLQAASTKDSLDVSEKMGELFEEYEQILKTQKDQELLQPSKKGTGGGDIRPSSSKLPTFAQFDGEGIPKSQDVRNIHKLSPILVKVPDLTKPKRKSSPNMIQLPPVVMESGGDMPKLNTPEDTKTIPSIQPYDSNNEYLQISVDAYDIIGANFNGG